MPGNDWTASLAICESSAAFTVRPVVCAHWEDSLAARLMVGSLRTGTPPALR